MEKLNVIVDSDLIDLLKPEKPQLGTNKSYSSSDQGYFKIPNELHVIVELFFDVKQPTTVKLEANGVLIKTFDLEQGTTTLPFIYLSFLHGYISTELYANNPFTIMVKGFKTYLNVLEPFLKIKKFYYPHLDAYSINNGNLYPTWLVKENEDNEDNKVKLTLEKTFNSYKFDDCLVNQLKTSKVVNYNYNGVKQRIFHIHTNNNVYHSATVTCETKAILVLWDKKSDKIICDYDISPGENKIPFVFMKKIFPEREMFFMADPVISICFHGFRISDKCVEELNSSGDWYFPGLNITRRNGALIQT